MSQDQRICTSLDEKLQIYAALSALSGRTDASLVEPRVLVQPHPEELPQAAVLLAAALQEGETLYIRGALQERAQAYSTRMGENIRYKKIGCCKIFPLKLKHFT